MSLHYASRLGLIAFSAVALRAVLEGAAFASGLQAALIGGTLMFLVGLCLGEIGRRLVEETVDERLKDELAGTGESK
jgi:hypothetical protein